MAERKVVNKYYPPDFDPSRIRRSKRRKHQQISVSMMLPITIRCNVCGNYTYRGTKFNSRKESVVGEPYLGRIQVFRFYFRCLTCCAEITIKTDPQNSDYIVESGATRNIEPWHVKDDKQNNEDGDDVMKVLEGKSAESMREMKMDAAVDELERMNHRRENISTDAIFGAFQQSPAPAPAPSPLEEEEEALIINSFLQESRQHFVYKIDDDDLCDNLKSSHRCQTSKSSTSSKNRKGNAGNGDNFIYESSSIRVSCIKKPKPKHKEEMQQSETMTRNSSSSNSSLFLLHQYDDDINVVDD